MILSYLRTSFRNLFRHRLYTLVNILGLAVGMAACILVGLFLQHEFSYDAYHRDIDRIHRVMRLVTHQVAAFHTIHSARNIGLAPHLSMNCPILKI